MESKKGENHPPETPAGALEPPGHRKVEQETAFLPKPIGAPPAAG